MSPKNNPYPKRYFKDFIYNKKGINHKGHEVHEE